MSNQEKIAHLEQIARLVRSHILTSTTRAGSGHPSSALSATDLMTGLVFGGTFRFKSEEPRHPNNDRLIFSKGHASPLLYALWAAASVVSEADLGLLCDLGVRLEHRRRDHRRPPGSRCSGSRGLARSSRAG